MELSSSSPSAPPISEPRPLTRSTNVSSEEHSLRRFRRDLRRSISGYLFLLPALLVFAVFVWSPIILGFAVSFRSINMINPRPKVCCWAQRLPPGSMIPGNAACALI